MLYTPLATIAALATSAPLFTTSFEFGAINSLTSSRRRVYPKINRLSRSNDWDIMGSSQSSSQQPRGGNDSLATGDDTNTVQLSATPDANDNENLVTQHPHPSTSTSYKFPSHPVKPLVHYVFLVHGYLGNDSEMSYLSEAFRSIGNGGQEDVDKENDDDSSGSMPDATRRTSAGSAGGDPIPEIIVHSVKCNVGKTHDGIRNGGTRLVNEIIHFIRKDIRTRVGDGDVELDDCSQDVTYSLVGNSLGGLYARYAIALLPHQLPFQQQDDPESFPDVLLNLHPNVFLTTATPHLGVSRHTYLPLPRIAETIIGAGMGPTGRDLFRLNSKQDLASPATDNIVTAAVGGVLRLRSLRKFKSEGNVVDASKTADDTTDKDEVSSNDEGDEMQCIIRNMSIREKYLMPLRIFRQRIAYANAYRTDFQVPTETAAFLNEKSRVLHTVIASRHAPSVRDEGSADESGEPFIVAVVRTQKTAQPLSPEEDELVQMSQSLDALGWTKVFIDIRDRMPVRGMAKPVWLRPQEGSLDDLIRERASLQLQSAGSLPDANGDSSMKKGVGTLNASLEIGAGECILTSRELAQSTASSGDNLNLPLGHTLMVANSKNERYSQLNSQGRPVMDKLASDMVRYVLEFE